MTRIARVEVIPFVLRFRRPYVTALGRLEHRELALLRIWTDGGIAGLGEAAPLSLRGGPDLRRIAHELERCRELLEGSDLGTGERQALHAARLVDRCARAEISAQAVAAIDIALLDLSAKALGQPVWSVLGANQARPVPCNATLSAGEPREVAEQARAWAERGFETFKLKLGTNGDVEQVAAVREALGPGARIRIDANCAWSRDEAVAKLAQLEPQDIELVEQPVSTLEDLAAIRRASSVPVIADESVASVDEAERAVRLDACDGVTVKLAKVGGVAAALSISAVLPAYLSSALDGPVGIAAAAHAAQTPRRAGLASDLAHGLATAELFENTVASVACEVHDAAITPSGAPGLGVEIDEDELRRHRAGLG